MDQIECTTAARETLHSWRFCHPHPRVQLNMEALSLQSQGLAPADSSRLCALSKTTFSRSLHAYRTGGIEHRTEGPWHQRQSPLADSRARSEAACRPCPPATVAAAGASIEALTGLRRGPTQVRQVIQS